MFVILAAVRDPLAAIRWPPFTAPATAVARTADRGQRSA
jgi:hypothetical protein